MLLIHKTKISIGVCLILNNLVAGYAKYRFYQMGKYIPFQKWEPIYTVLKLKGSLCQKCTTKDKMNEVAFIGSTPLQLSNKVAKKCQTPMVKIN